jgi:hypothetical protein
MAIRFASFERMSHDPFHHSQYTGRDGHSADWVEYKELMTKDGKISSSGTFIGMSISSSSTLLL